MLKSLSQASLAAAAILALSAISSSAGVAVRASQQVQYIGGGGHHLPVWGVAEACTFEHWKTGETYQVCRSTLTGEVISRRFIPPGW